MSDVRIAVTGLGLVTPLGRTRESSWAGFQQGQQAGRWLTFEWNPSQSNSSPPLRSRYPVAVVPDDITKTTADIGCSRLEAFAIHAAQEATQQASLTPAHLHEAVCVIGTSKGDHQAIESLVTQESACSSDLVLQEWKRSPLFSGNVSACVAEILGCQAGAISPVAACATGLVSLIQAANMIRHGAAPIAIAGASDASLQPTLLASYSRLGVLAKTDGNPAGACRPFDTHRNGFIVGEGAGVLILEEWEHARQRGVQPIAEWIDGRLAGDPTGMTAVNPQGTHLTEILSRLCDSSHVDPEDISLISVHGTGTRMNDLSEARALRTFFSKTGGIPPCFGLKGAIGHLMGAAGAVESAALTLALQNRVIPPTVNHLEPDPECDLPLLSSAKSLASARYGLKVSLGFGGSLAVGLFGSVDKT